MVRRSAHLRSWPCRRCRMILRRRRTGLIGRLNQAAARSKQQNEEKLGTVVHTGPRLALPIQIHIDPRPAATSETANRRSFYGRGAKRGAPAAGLRMPVTAFLALLQKTSFAHLPFRNGGTGVRCKQRKLSVEAPPRSTPSMRRILKFWLAARRLLSARQATETSAESPFCTGNSLSFNRKLHWIACPAGSHGGQCREERRLRAFSFQRCAG